MAKREAVAEQDDTQGGTYRLELVSCGKDRCRKCAEGPGHGPYWYRYYRRGGRVVSKYVGKNLPAGTAAPAAAGGGDAGAVWAPGKGEEAIIDATIKNILDAARPEHRAGILAQMPPEMRADVDAAIARAEEAQRQRAEKRRAKESSQPAAGPTPAERLAAGGLGREDLLALARDLGSAASPAGSTTAAPGCASSAGAYRAASGRPGTSTTRPRSASRIEHYCNQQGIRIRDGRTAALVELAGQLPPAVLADLLGLHPSTATAWARRIASDWAAYIDARNRSKGDSGHRYRRHSAPEQTASAPSRRQPG